MKVCTGLSNKKRIGVALSTGSARALAHIGVLKVLEKEGIKIDVISGTSFGGLIAGMYASGMKPDEIEEKFLKITKSKLFSIFRPAPKRSGFIDKKRLEKLVREFVKDVDISELKIPFGVPCVDVMTGEKVVIDKGSLIRAIMATMAYPIVFTPIEYDGRYLLDGGIIDPLPVDIARRLGAEIVIASMPFPGGNERLAKISENMLNSRVNEITHFLMVEKETNNCKNQKKSLNMAHIFMQLSSILENQSLLLQWQEHKPDILIVPDVKDLKPLEFYRARETILQGEKATRRAIPSIKRIIEALG